MFNSNFTQTALSLAVAGWMIMIVNPQQASAQRLSLEDLNNKILCISVSSDADDLYFEGCNVHVRDGSGSSGIPPFNGKGNLIVGYNEEDTGAKDRSGSHNLIIGPEHTYTNFGGLVAGYKNTVSARNASVSGGRFNVAGEFGASVSGGESNKVYGFFSSIGGGIGNLATGNYGSVSGGQDNEIIYGFYGYGASVSGGTDNKAGGLYSYGASVSGGTGNTATAGYTTGATVSGGYGNATTADYDHLP